MDILKQYVERFNRDDEEIYGNDIRNADVYQWMKEEVPLFECPDKDIERAYYFRFWTYRKHIRSTEDGKVVTEFLPKVPWSGKHNTINAAAGHHLYEGRWLKNAEKYLRSYIDFFLSVSEKSHAYSTWLIDAAYSYSSVTGDFRIGEDLIGKLDRYYKEWERLRGLENGSFWSIDDQDAMEFSVSGTGDNMKQTRGIRPTLNSYMCADALALSRFAEKYGNKAISQEYMQKHLRLKKFINKNLFEDGFYRAYHYTSEEDPLTVTSKNGVSPRELIGYIPFMFNIPEKGREACFDLLADKKAFFTEYGLTTVEQSHPKYLFPAKHECLWNGYIWPFATAQTLTALKNVAQATGDQKYADMFVSLLSQYARMHTRTREDGSTVCWIDEVMDPRSGDWSSRTLLKDWGWKEGKGGYERGKDYNHSTFCDLVISGLVGISVDEGKISASPLAPDSWRYYRLSGVRVLGKEYDIVYDKDGTVYGKEKGLTVTEI